MAWEADGSPLPIFLDLIAKVRVFLGGYFSLYLLLDLYYTY